MAARLHQRDVCGHGLGTGAARTVILRWRWCDICVGYPGLIPIGSAFCVEEVFIVGGREPFWCISDFLYGFNLRFTYVVTNQPPADVRQVGCELLVQYGVR